MDSRPPARLTTIWLFARTERALAARSRATQVFAAVFAVLAAGVAGAGYVLTGGHGFQDFARTSVALIQLVLLLVPLMALVLGVLTLTPDRGTAELIFAQPVSRTSVLFGRLLGLWLALAGAQLLGFGAAGLVVGWNAGPQGVGGFLLLVAGSLVLTAVFLGLSALLAGGTGGRRRARALAVALATWFALVVLYDVAVLLAASLLPSAIASRTLVIATIVNPADAVRTGVLLAIEGTEAFGPASRALLRMTGGPAGAAAAICLSLAAWLGLSMLLAARRLNRADI